MGSLSYPASPRNWGSLVDGLLRPELPGRGARVGAGVRVTDLHPTWAGVGRPFSG